MAAIVTPTIRTPLLAAESGSAGRSHVRTPTTKDWWLYWDALTRTANQNTAEIKAIEDLIAAAVRIGTHDERLAEAPEPIGALWMESDRNNVIYQAQTVADEPQWVYLTGAMYGTAIAVDERPTDLAANDTGFIFLSSDSPSVRWTGAIWGPLDYVAEQAVVGGPGLTHPNVVAKVGATGEVVEGGITDESAGNSDRVRITAAGNVGIGIPNPISKFEVKDGVDRNLYIGALASTVAGSMVIAALNDAISANTPVELRASVVAITVGGLQITNLPSTNPGAGSKRIWYDPADANRVKFAP